MSVLLLSSAVSVAVLVDELLFLGADDGTSEAVSVVSLNRRLVGDVCDGSECLCDHVRLPGSAGVGIGVSLLFAVCWLCDDPSESLCDHLRLARSYIFLNVGFGFFFVRPVKDVSDVDLFSFLVFLVQLVLCSWFGLVCWS